MTELRVYRVWDAPTRWFHWINVLCVIALVAVGLVILKAGALDISNAGKVTLKAIHVLIGYVLALNLLGRILWAFIGNRYARWRSFLPGGKGYGGRVRRYASAFVSAAPEQHLGHNPLGRLAATALLLLIFLQVVTGLVLAGTDLFYPPFGHWIAQWVAAAGVPPASLVPYAPDLYDPGAWDAMRSWRKPVIWLHEYNFYALAGLVIVHIAAVVVTDLREGGSIISAMFTGNKIIRGKPVDDVSAPGD